jgi:DNA-binding MarR family transcriptional regulator
MSSDLETPPPSSATWLTPGQMRAWLAYVRVMHRLTYEMNRQLQADSGLSLADYDVLAALSDAPEGRLQLTELATWIGWELSRVSHHVRRMCVRGLTRRETSRVDGRATDAVLTEQGRAAIAAAAPGHVELVKRLFFAPLNPELLESLSEALQKVHEYISLECRPPTSR